MRLIIIEPEAIAADQRDHPSLIKFPFELHAPRVGCDSFLLRKSLAALVFLVRTEKQIGYVAVSEQ